MEQLSGRKHSIPLLPVLLAISVCLNIVQSALTPVKETNSSVVGTYYSTQTINGMNMVVVLTKDGQYCRYQPGNVLETGIYRIAEQNVYKLSGDHAGMKDDTAVIFNDTMVVILDGGSFIKLSKTLDYPYYDNVPELKNTD